MQQELKNGVWKRKFVRHVGTARSDLDLKLLMETAKQTLNQLERPNQLRFPFPSEMEASGLRTIGEFHQEADLVLGNLFDRLGICGREAELLCFLVMARFFYPAPKEERSSF